MEDKDILEKVLMSHGDVFANCVNAEEEEVYMCKYIGMLEGRAYGYLSESGK